MAWIEIHQELRDHPKVIRLSNLLKCKKAEALGYVVSLWLWAIAYARCGDLTNFSNDEIAAGCNFVGDDAKILVEALTTAVLIDQKDGKKLIHDWKKHGLRILEQSKKRMAKSRKNNGLDGKAVTQPLRNCDALLSLFLSNHSNLSNLSLLSSPEFALALNEWIVYRIEKKKRLTETQLEKQIEWLSKQGNPIACIEQTIRNGWQGLFELKENYNGTTRQGGGSAYKPARGTQAARLAYDPNSPEAIAGRKNLQATLEQRDRERRERAGSD